MKWACKWKTEFSIQPFTLVYYSRLIMQNIYPCDFILLANKMFHRLYFIYTFLSPGLYGCSLKSISKASLQSLNNTTSKMMSLILLSKKCPIHSQQKCSRKLIFPLWALGGSKINTEDILKGKEITTWCSKMFSRKNLLHFPLSNIKSHIISKWQKKDFRVVKWWRSLVFCDLNS